jgi:hypothetical protein
MPALPPALSILIKCCKNKLAVSPVFMGKFCCTSARILHGVEAPNIIHTNTLAENLADIQEKDRYDIILANPPFGGKERAEVQQNFPGLVLPRFLFRLS